MNQSYPNAASGLKLIFWGKILSIVGVLVTGVGAGLAAVTGLSAVAMLGLLVVIAAYVLDIFGLYKAGDDDQGYRMPLMASVIALAINVVFNFLGTIPFVSALLSIISSILNLVVVGGVCQTTGNLLHSVGNDVLAQRGATVSRLYCVCTIIYVVCTIISVIPIINVLGDLVLVISSIVLLVGYIMYLTFLSGSGSAL